MKCHTRLSDNRYSPAAAAAAVVVPDDWCALATRLPLFTTVSPDVGTFDASRGWADFGDRILPD